MRWAWRVANVKCSCGRCHCRWNDLENVLITRLHVCMYVCTCYEDTPYCGHGHCHSNLRRKKLKESRPSQTGFSDLMEEFKLDPSPTCLLWVSKVYIGWTSPVIHTLLCLCQHSLFFAIVVWLTFPVFVKTKLARQVSVNVYREGIYAVTFDYAGEHVSRM